MEHIEHTDELVSVLKGLREENAAQRKLLEKQCRITRRLGLLLVCLVAVVAVFLFTLLPKISSTLNELDVVVANTKEITEELKAADIEGTIRSLQDALTSIDTLVNDSSESISVSLKKLEAMDIETLNKAIQDLYRVVDPLASLFSR